MTRLNVPKNPAHRREWIKYQLGLRGLSFAELGRRNGVTRKAVQIAVATPYPRMELIIASAIGIEPHQLWPERYNPDGTPKSGRGVRGRYRPKSSTSRVRNTDAEVA